MWLWLSPRPRKLYSNVTQIDLMFFATIFAASSDNEDINLFLNLTEEAFLEIFDLPPVDDPKERTRRGRTLKEHQQAVLQNNQLYLAGRRTWFEGINEFSDIPDDEFIANHTGLIVKEDPEELDKETRLVIDESLMASLPASYDSVSLGHVSPVKKQGTCGSCVAFATISLVETCFKKTVGVFGDYSEQHLLDCAYGARLVNGCKGSWPFGYTSWLATKKPRLATEKSYPYKGRVGTCRTDYEELNQGAKISRAYTTGWKRGNEEILKALVYKHGAVMVAIAAHGANGNFKQYRGGIFSGCSKRYKISHAVVVVGYGTQDGLDYWLVKNSWGKGWGEQGYMKIQRGVNMCGIGTTQVTLSCEALEEKTNTGSVSVLLVRSVSEYAVIGSTNPQTNSDKIIL